MQRLERGAFRPRPSLLAAVAWAIDPDEAPRIYAELVTAAGDDLAPDTAGWRRYRAKRLNRAMRTGTVPVPVKVTAAVDGHQAATRARKQASSVLASPGAADDPLRLAAAATLLEEAAAARAAAGKAAVVQVGASRRTFGAGQDGTS